jgi:hypothetical protein
VTRDDESVRDYALTEDGQLKDRPSRLPRRRDPCSGDNTLAIGTRIARLILPPSGFSAASSIVGNTEELWVDSDSLMDDGYEWWDVRTLDGRDPHEG